MTPEPRPCWRGVLNWRLGICRPPWSPKKWRQKGSLRPKPSGTEAFMTLEVTTIFTTPGATFFTIGAKLVEGPAARGRGLSSTSTLAEADVALGLAVSVW